MESEGRQAALVVGDAGLAAGMEHEVQFDLENPAEAQAAPAVSLSMSLVMATPGE